MIASIEDIIIEMAKQSKSELNNTFYLPKSYEGKNLSLDGYYFFYTDLVKEDTVYLGPSMLFNENNNG